MPLVTFTPPGGNLHSIDFSRERVLLVNRNTTWTLDFTSKIVDEDIDLFLSTDHPEWELERSFVATLIPLLFHNEHDARNLTLLGKHISSGKLLVCCTSSFIYGDHVRAMCDFEGIPVLTSSEDLTLAALKRLGCGPKEEIVPIPD